MSKINLRMLKNTIGSSFTERRFRPGPLVCAGFVCVALDQSSGSGPSISSRQVAAAVIRYFLSLLNAYSS